jgi:hypothetical protein
LKTDPQPVTVPNFRHSIDFRPVFELNLNRNLLDAGAKIIPLSAGKFASPPIPCRVHSNQFGPNLMVPVAPGGDVL